MSGNYNRLRDKDAETRKVLEGSENMLQDQEDKLKNVVGLMKETNEIMQDGKGNLFNQRNKIKDAIVKNEDIGTKLVRADKLAVSISGREFWTKFSLYLLMVLLGIACIIVAIYK